MTGGSMQRAFPAAYVIVRYGGKEVPGQNL